MKSTTIGISVVTLSLGFAALGCGATSPTGTGGAGGTGGSGGGTNTCAAAFPAVTDFAASGPYATTKETNTGPNGAYTLFRPTTLGEGGLKHPILTWGNGTFVTP